MTVRFLSIAEHELANASEYYDREKPGLGLEFMLEVDAAIERVVEYPEAWPQISDRVRRCRTRRFPFGVLYQLRDDYGPAPRPRVVERSYVIGEGRRDPRPLA